MKEEGFCCTSIIECEGTGKYSDPEKEHFSSLYLTEHASKVIKLEIIVLDEHVRKIIDIIKRNGRTGYSGDGMIIVSPVDNVHKIRTDEEGNISNLTNKHLNPE